MGGMATSENSNGGATGDANISSNTNSNAKNLLDGDGFTAQSFTPPTNGNLLDAANTYDKPLTTTSPSTSFSYNNLENKSNTNSFSKPNAMEDDSGFEAAEATEIDYAAELKRKNDLHAKQQLKLQKEKAAAPEETKQQHYKLMDQQKKAQEKAAEQAHKQAEKLQQDTAKMTSTMVGSLFKTPAAKVALAKAAPNPMQNIMNKLADGTKKAAVKKPMVKAAFPKAPPAKPDPTQLVSEAAKMDNEGIKNTLLNKSSDVSGLSPLIDGMIKEDSLGGKAVTEDLIKRVRKEDPDTAQKLELLTNPIFKKYAAAIHQEQAAVDDKYAKEYQAYEQSRLKAEQQTKASTESATLPDHTLDSMRNNGSVFTERELGANKNLNLGEEHSKSETVKGASKGNEDFRNAFFTNAENTSSKAGEKVTANQLPSQLRSIDVRESNQAIQTIQNLRAEDEQAYQALPEETRLWFEAHQRKYRTHAPNFLEDTPQDIKDKNNATSHSRGAEAAGSLYSGTAVEEEVTELGQKFTIGLSLLNGDQPDYAKFDQEIKRLRDSVPERYRHTSTFQGGKELTGVLTTAVETIPFFGAPASAGDTARELNKAGFSLTVQRIGAGIAGLTNLVGGGLAKKGVNDMLLKNFGKDLKKLTSKELETLSENLLGEGMELTVDGIVKTATESRSGNKSRND